MEQNFTNEELTGQIEKNSKKANELINDVNKLERFLERLENKLKKVPVFGKKLSIIPVFVSLVRSYVHKEYSDIPFASIITIIGALIYFVSPIDLIPDAIPVIGVLDDAAVIAFALKMVEDDVEEYKRWKESNEKKLLEY